MKFGKNLGSGLGAEMQAYLDKTLLTNISENSIFDRLATMQRGLPLRNSQEIRFDKWVRMTDLYLANNLNTKFTNNTIDVAANKDEETLQLVPTKEYENFVLNEGSSGASKAQMKLIKQKADVFAIGDWMPFTEEMEMFHNRWTAAETSKQMGEMAGVIIDGFYRDLYSNGAGHVLNVTAGKTVGSPEFTAACRKMYIALKLSGAQPVNSIMKASALYGTVPVRAKYTGYIHTVGAEMLRDNADFVPVEKYNPNGGAMENEVGIIGELRIIENANAPLEEKSAGVYTAEMIVCGRDHTAHIPIRGKGATEFILQSLGSGGTSDPLKRSGTAGWKSWLGAKVLYPERLGIIKVEVNF